MINVEMKMADYPVRGIKADTHSLTKVKGVIIPNTSLYWEGRPAGDNRRAGNRKLIKTISDKSSQLQLEKPCKKEKPTCPCSVSSDKPLRRSSTVLNGAPKWLGPSNRR